MDVIIYGKLKLYEVYRNIKMINYRKDTLALTQEIYDKEPFIDKRYVEIHLDFNEEEIFNFEVRE